LVDFIILLYTSVDTYTIGQHYIWPAYYYNPFVKSGFTYFIDSRITSVDMEYSSV